MCILYMEKRIARGGKGYELYCTVYSYVDTDAPMGIGGKRIARGRKDYERFSIQYSKTQTHPWEYVGTG